MTKLRYLLWLVAGILGITAPRLLAETVDLNTNCTFSGQVPNMTHTAEKFGVALRVGLQGISYSGQLSRTLLEQSQPGKVTLWFGFRNVKLTVNRTDITGAPGGASCGPMSVVAGQNKELWLAFDIISDNKPNSNQMVVKDVRFQLPPDNLMIGRPAWVQTRGIGFTQQNVVDGIRQSIAKDRAKIEQKLAKDAPQILSEVVRKTRTQTGESPVVQAVRERLQTNPPQTLSASAP